MTDRSDAEKWRKLVKWCQDTKDDEDTDIWEFLESLGLSATGVEKQAEPFTYVDDNLPLN